jgi:hypothetical protein
MSFHLAGLTAWLAGEGLYIWGFAVAGLAGLAAGLMYRAGAVIILSIACVIFAAITGVSQGWTVWGGVLTTAALLAFVQTGYLTGVGLTVRVGSLKGKTAVQWLYSALFKRDTAG